VILHKSRFVINAVVRCRAQGWAGHVAEAGVVVEGVPTWRGGGSCRVSASRLKVNVDG
jgi:hypothetical protein